ncbi:MAG: helix-turn-helix domain-containing protein [bacterium]|nr:helix-turn-helix domain-containing protein [bacterium]
MPIFCPKPIQPPARVGDKLRLAREAAKLSLADFAVKTGVAEKYLMALENGRYDDLPKTSAFRLAYLRSYFTALNLEPRLLLKQFKDEGGLKGTEHKSDITKIKTLSARAPFLHLRNSALILVILSFLFYLGWQVKGIMQKPELIVYTPVEGMISGQLKVSVQGQSEKEVTLTINGQAIMVDETGHFGSTVDLSNGVNTIIITATKKHGKSSTITRHVVVNKTNEKYNLNN